MTTTDQNVDYRIVLRRGVVVFSYHDKTSGEEKTEKLTVGELFHV